MKSNGEAVIFGGYKIAITEVAPIKSSGEAISKDSYRLTFTVTSTASGNNI